MTPCLVLFLLFAFASPISLLSADKPLWVLDPATIGVPDNWNESSAKGESRYSRINLQVSADDEIIISFNQRRKQIDLATKSTPEKSGSVLVSLFISPSDGKLIRKNEWPVMGESSLQDQISRGSRIQALASGGYVGIINGHLQVLDSSMKVLNERFLNRPDEDRVYKLFTSLSGPFFILAQRYSKLKDKVEIIDSRTLVTTGREDLPDIGMQDIWEDHLLGIQEQGQTIYNLKARKIGGSWLDIALKPEPGQYTQARFTNNGDIVVAAYHNNCHLWFVIKGSARSDAIVYPRDEIIRNIIAARRASIIAIRIAKWGGVRALLDMNSASCVVVYDLTTQQMLLKTKARDDMIGYAISSDGRSLAVLTEKKLEMYDVPAKSTKKK
jgi:hypothetical protein